MSKLLINEAPLQVLPALAVAIGLNEAIVLQQLHYWLETSKHTHEGQKWSCSTLNDWGEQFPFWSKSTIERILATLRNQGLIASKQLSQDPLNRTNYHTINYQAQEGLAALLLDGLLREGV
jgi:hypothetical protein